MDIKTRLHFDNVLKQWSPPCGPCGLCELFPNVCISLRIFLDNSSCSSICWKIFQEA